MALRALAARWARRWHDRGRGWWWPTSKLSWPGKSPLESERTAGWLPLELDVADFISTKRLVENTFQHETRLDYVFNNAGIGIIGEARLYQLVLTPVRFNSPERVQLQV